MTKNYIIPRGVYSGKSPLPPPGGEGFISSCWGRKSSGEEGNGKRGGKKGREGPEVKEIFPSCLTCKTKKSR